ncbi:enoyl-CoA hydratase/isomerase family protein [Novosphingobium album (ex Hu et al. 2023)]|uniref:Enoyl-CoA hydratase/isomerase family protein n=1 Tax=Novosphingobium album (ex Hu et al. 2023) TaxID=2930093 RepID=A0ABT0AX77_9SPHN|nr:enoyl-CoA hydratase/isomerase family protein [Novosphingobium album (ex Hu et al. 2023)]MCJ2177381.1 enoyl-CoA hydratase/isomerase family protein [Novosphingobium album (ex Hu et al. 2023)]
MSFEVSTQKHGHVGEIRFSAPPHNFASSGMLCAIADAIYEMDGDEEVRCILLTAEGKVFCGGADLAGADAVQGADGMSEIALFYENAARIMNRKKVMIAAVQGAAIGAGLGLALAADFRIASAAARFSANFVKLGFHPGFAITYTLPRVIGEQKAAWLMLSGNRIKAQEALNLGLIDRLAPAENLLAEALTMAGEIACNAPLALLAIRETLASEAGSKAAATMRHEHAEQTKLKETSDYAEGVAAVFERRTANFTGR